MVRILKLSSQAQANTKHLATTIFQLGRQKSSQIRQVCQLNQNFKKPEWVETILIQMVTLRNAWLIC